jgi:hypothetical protein
VNTVPTTDQIRHAIDQGITGEKVAFPDPAAAPLGTDAEAGGSPPTHAERAVAAESQPVYRAPVTLNGLAIYLAAVIVLAAAILLIGYGATPIR